MRFCTSVVVFNLEHRSFRRDNLYQRKTFLSLLVLSTCCSSLLWNECLPRFCGRLWSCELSYECLNIHRCPQGQSVLAIDFALAFMLEFFAALLLLWNECLHRVWWKVPEQ